ncbi:tellurite resistance TerB family protein [Gammaproteobacteria bacterium]|nr:tellurite resistance TerB family protein [Gammaproteobacteria bacterium]
MEFIFTMLLIWGGWYLFVQVLGQGSRAVGAAAKTVTSGGSFSDNFSNKFQLKIEKLKEEDYEIYGVFGKGSPEVHTSSPVVFIFKLYDKETAMPILSTFEETSESGSRVFEHSVSIGNIANQYYPDWSRLSFLMPDSLIGPHKGTRRLDLHCYIWTESERPAFVNGYLGEGADQRGGINIIRHDFDFYLGSAGYMEIDKERLQVQEASVKLAISIALADGDLDQKEGNEIKQWIKGIVDSSLESKQQEIKDTLNKSLEDGFSAAKENAIDIKQICIGIKDIGSKADKYDLLELCLDVMAADGEADKNELAQISEISSLIGIDYEEVNKLKDQRLIKLNPDSLSESGLEEILGIDPNWDKDKIKKHLRELFKKYNARIVTVAEGPERENAQTMIDKIAEARKKYS